MTQSSGKSLDAIPKKQLISNRKNDKHQGSNDQKFAMSKINLLKPGIGAAF